MKSLNPLLIAFALTGGLTVAAPISTPAAAGVDAENPGFELADQSQLAAIVLPEGAMRSTNQEDIDKIAEALKVVAKTNHGTMSKVEVLIWQGAAAVSKLPGALKDAGYTYKAKDSFDAEVGKVTPFGAANEDSHTSLLGMWIKPKGVYTLLAWGVFQPDADRDSTDDAADVKPAKYTTSDSHGGVPADMVGQWSWTTISGVNYEDANTGRLLSPSGMAAKFTFLPDGRYKFFFYVHQRTYNIVTQSTTNEEGRVTFNGDGTFTMRPEHGHYNGNTGSRIIDRDMTAAERKPKTYSYVWRDADGKRELSMGPSASSLSRFTREK